ncbi:hypothetical protein ACSQ67_018267 [Phaseolus vulgaris]
MNVEFLVRLDNRSSQAYRTPDAYRRRAQEGVLQGCIDTMNGGMIEMVLDPDLNKTGDIWHICIELYSIDYLDFCLALDLPRSNVLYGYRIDGPQDWSKGHRFDSSIVLVDPYAKLVEGENYKLPNISEVFSLHKCLSLFKDLVIYEMNVRAFTIDESSGLDSNIRDSTPSRAGINAVELLPVFEFNELEFQRRPNPRDHMINTWGYSTINFFSPMSSYASAGGRSVNASREFKEMVKALHSSGIEVILDVVYNHTNEADDANPYTTSFRGIDNKVYYMLDNNGQLLNFSGCVIDCAFGSSLGLPVKWSMPNVWAGTGVC